MTIQELYAQRVKKHQESTVAQALYEQRLKDSHSELESYVAQLKANISDELDPSIRDSLIELECQLSTYLNNPPALESIERLKTMLEDIQKKVEDYIREELS